MITIIQYAEYFEHQATHHPDLLHAQDNLSYAFMSLESAVSDLRSVNVSRSGFLLRAVEPSFQCQPGPDNRPLITVDGGYVVLGRYSIKEFGATAYLSVLQETQKIAEDIKEKMYADSEAGHPFFQQQANETLSITKRTMPVAGDAGYGGWIYLFTYQIHGTYCSPADRVAWTDQGLTPFAT
ncbi:MAG: hypothetical protein AAF828_01515 [Bacteroidota bacterium]